MKFVPATFVLVLLLVVPAATAAVEEIDLPDDYRRPLNLKFDQHGDLWFTLDGTWAMARYRVTEQRFDLATITALRMSPQDSLFGLDVAPDGTVWTVSQSHLHQVDPGTLNVTSHALPTPSQLSGGVWIAPDGNVWAALVAADVLVRLNPDTESVHEFPLDIEQLGPVMFHERDGQVWLTATYAGSYAEFDPQTGGVSVGPRNLFSAPVGLDSDGGGLWIAEHGANNLGRVDANQDTALHYPASKSPHHMVSGPNDVIVAQDGAVWFTEHLGERIARLDPEARVLVEYDLPSAPQANVLFLTEAPDGTIWYASWAKHKLGHVRFEPPTLPPELPATVRVQRGDSVEIQVPDGYGEAGVPIPELNATVRQGRLTIQTDDAPAGDWLVLVAQRQGDMLVGRYLTLQISESEESPAPSPLIVIMLACALLASSRRYGRCT